MAFIVTLMLSLSIVLQTQMTTSTSNKHIRESKEIALLGLSIAIGELQTTAGPDQRVTARAEILEANGVNIDPSMAMLTGAWDSRPYDPTAAKNNTLIDWLVSYPPDMNPIDITRSIQDQLSEKQRVVLVKNNANSNSISIEAGLIPIQNDQNVTTGNYGFWVSDEGVKAKLFVQGEESAASNESSRTLSVNTLGGSLSPQPAILPELQGMQPSRTEKSSLVSYSQIQNFPSLTVTEKEALQNGYHDFSVDSKGLAIDVKNGGFKKDLSLAFEMDDSTFNDDPNFSGLRANRGIQDRPAEPFEYRPIFSQTDNRGYQAEGPTWHLLRNYYRLYKDVDWSNFNEPVIQARPYSPSTQQLRETNGGVHFVYDMSRYYSGRSAKGRDLFTDQASNYVGGDLPIKRTAPAITPVVTRMQYIFSLVAEPLEPGDPIPENTNATDYNKVSLVFDRVIAIWNPYNTPMKFLGISSWYNQGSVPIDIHLIGNGSELLVSDASNFQRFADVSINRPEAGAVTIPQPLDTISTTGSFLTNSTNDILQPGELRILSASDLQPNSQENPTTRILSEGFNSAGGIKVPLKVAGQLVYLENGGEVQARLGSHYLQPNSTVNGSNASRLQAEHHLIIDDSATVLELQELDDTDLRGYNKVSSISTFEFNLEEANSNSNFAGWSPPLSFGITEKSAFGMLDVQLKPGATNRGPVVVGDYSPIAPSVAATFMHYQGYTGTPPNWHFELKDISDIVSESAIINSSTDGKQAFWGDQVTSSGGIHNAVVYEIPLTPMQSLGSLRHAPLAVIPEHPMHPFGSSRAHPALSQNNTIELINSWENNQYSLFDLSYLSNEAVWDEYFFSSIAPRELGFYPNDEAQDLTGLFTNLYDGPEQNTIANAGYQINQGWFTDRSEFIAHFITGGNAHPEAYKRIGRHIIIDGAFNVNSTSIRAWATLLASARDQSIQTIGTDGTFKTEIPDSLETIFSRARIPNGDSSDKWSGFNALTDAEIWDDQGTQDQSDDTGLAVEIVRQVKARGPFLNMADFVNRRLRNDDLGLKGALQTAIDDSGINNTISNQVNSGDLPPGINNATAAEGPQSLGAPGVLDQGDLLTQLAPYLTVRSDTFKIRFYGESIDTLSGEVKASSIGEAIVQRVSEPVTPGSNDSLTDDYWIPQDQLGRRFEIVSFKWLAEDEV
ncbi:hypothetical protein [Rubellicoccus peritrichatus]|uniref:Uncharacterized protein n=1 Tax=Rubellicoccus peritrichatus TaxID=3080537 RepID=A0AAQ3LDH6_9BACT|nr:hypothetical protein [Puniceicoccus sp. CR14]WOO40069.1 hypothetical protein RZN69_15705 [Puniceicoccus sp. CR14]